MPADNSPHTLGAYLKGLDLVPYVAVLALPFAWAFWAMGVPGEGTPEQIEASWWFKGYVAVLLYAPSMAICWAIEWKVSRREWPGLRFAVAIFRWAHFLIVMGPLIILMAAIFVPPFGRLIF